LRRAGESRGIRFADEAKPESGRNSRNWAMSKQYMSTHPATHSILAEFAQVHRLDRSVIRVLRRRPEDSSCPSLDFPHGKFLE
jgi:hypothetical protein